eukprot:SAG25_NODE_1207_length_3613_cov_6.866249_3_plen_102_part_00
MTLRAGDVLYLPPFWWHEVTSLEHENVSLALWLEGVAPAPAQFLSSSSGGIGAACVKAGVQMGVGRNIELALLRQLQVADDARSATTLVSAVSGISVAYFD